MHHMQNYKSAKQVCIGFQLRLPMHHLEGYDVHRYYTYGQDVHLNAKGTEEWKKRTVPCES